MIVQFVPRLVATSVLAATLWACSSGTDDPYASPSPNVNPVSPGTSTSVTPTPTGTVNPGGTAIDPTKRFGTPVVTGSGMSSAQYATSDVTRDGMNFHFMSNGWGPGFESQTTAWDGTSFTVVSMQGKQGPQYEPATYPTVFCGIYSRTSKECGLPKELSTITSLKTGWSWSPASAGSNEQYNAAYDVWLGTSAAKGTFSGYFMVWLREPPGQQPAGSLDVSDVTVTNVPGVWDIWEGMVNGAPIINYVRAVGADTHSLEFDMMDFIRDAQTRGYQIPGTFVHSVAVGFEIWNGPISNLQSHDFYLEVL